MPVGRLLLLLLSRAGWQVGSVLIHPLQPSLLWLSPSLQVTSENGTQARPSPTWAPSVKQAGAANSLMRAKRKLHTQNQFKVAGLMKSEPSAGGCSGFLLCPCSTMAAGDLLSGLVKFIPA